MGLSISKETVRTCHMSYYQFIIQPPYLIYSYRHHEAHYSQPHIFLKNNSNHLPLYQILETRDSWSRDDPAFLVCICVFLAMSTFGYSLFLRLGVGGFLLSLLLTELLDCILSGVIVASIMW